MGEIFTAGEEHLEGISEVVSCLYDNPSEELISRLKFDFIDRNVEWKVYSEGNDIIGAMSLVYVPDSKIIRIDELVVKDGCRGNGIGRRLVGVARDEGLLKRCRLLTVGSMLNYDAKGFYVSVGFKHNGVVCSGKDRYHHFGMKL